MDIVSAEPVNGADAAWLCLETPVNLLVITALAITEPMGFADFRQLVQRRFLSFRRFRQKPMAHSGLYFWQDDESFCLDYHLRRVALPAPADKRALQDYLGEVMSTPLDPQRPRWQFLFVESFGGQSAIIMRVHHCYADGLSLVAVFGALTDAAANVRPFPGCEALSEVAMGEASQSGGDPLQNSAAGNDANGQSPGSPAAGAPAAGSQSAGTAVSLFSKGLRHLIGAAERATRLRFRLDPASALGDGAPGGPADSAPPPPGPWQAGLTGMAELARLAALPSDPVTALKRAPGLMKGCAWSAKIPLQEFRQVANALGCRINDVLVAIVCAGLRTHLLKSQSLAADACIHATLPVNLRSPSGDLASGELGNQFGTVFVPLAVGLDNPLERLYKTKHDMIALKQSGLPALSHWVMGLTGMLPRGWQSALLDQFSNKTSLVLSNVPGAPGHRYLAGRKVRELMFWVPQAGELCLGVSLLSHGGAVQIGVNGDRNALPDPAELLDAMLDAFEIYRRLARLPGSAWRQVQAD